MVQFLMWIFIACVGFLMMTVGGYYAHDAWNNFRKESQEKQEAVKSVDKPDQATSPEIKSEGKRENKIEERRIYVSAERIEKIENYIHGYQFSLRALISSLPLDNYKPKISIGTSVIWPCLDGAIVLIFESESRKIDIIVKASINETMNSFLEKSDALYLYSKKGERLPIPFTYRIGDSLIAFMHITDTTVKPMPDGDDFRPKHQRMIIAGWNADLPHPDECALNDFKSIYIAHNIGESDVRGFPSNRDKEITYAHANKLVGKFRELLDTSTKKEELMNFLTHHPELIYPDFIECQPNVTIVGTFLANFVFLVQGVEGPDYKFVVIKRPDEHIFEETGHFTTNFTKASEQILENDKWITSNKKIIENALPGFVGPKFHLVMGRSRTLTLEHRERIKKEFAPKSISFSTYDDLVSHFEQIINRMVKP